MILILSMLPALLLAFPKRSPIRHHPAACYGIAAGLAVWTVSAVWSGRLQALPGWFASFSEILTQGGLSGSLFILVMYAGAAPNRSRFRKIILPIRGELSILASILSLGHNIAYGRKYFGLLLTAADELRPNVLAAAICSLVMISVMLPLFITSFRCVRRRMRPKRWKRLQRLAYLFYALLPIHILLLNYPSAMKHHPEAVLNCVLYASVFLGYAVMRTRKAWNGSRKLVAVFLGFTVWLAVLLPISGTGAGSETEAREISEVRYADGTYTGAAIGYNGKLKVSVTVSGGCIQEIVLLSAVDDEPYLSKAAQRVFAQAVEQNSWEIDSVSGATTTADALADAICEALAKAEAVNRS